MRPKGKLFALFAVFAAIGLVTASGAFTTVTADRTVSVNVAGDSNALLGITPNSEYGSENSDGVVVLEFDNPAGTSGVNANATTTVDEILTLTNNGDSTVALNISADDSRISFYNTTDGTGSDANTTSLTSGGTHDVGIKIDTTNDGNSTEFDANVTIVANATASQ
jgi:hypothetical protein